MATELEKALARSGYVALPLAREGCEPTSVLGFERGQLYVVRNPHKSFPNPPIEITESGSVDAFNLDREFSFKIDGMATFILSTLGIGSARAELEASSVRSATVRMSGLVHHNVETGELIQYLLTHDAASAPAIRDVLDPDHMTVVAALSAETFAYTFRTGGGVVVKLSAPEAEQLFKANANIQVSTSSSGSVVVSSRRFVGVLLWSGKKFAQEMKKAREATRSPALRSSPRVSSPTAGAVSAAELTEKQLASFGVTRARSQKKRPAASRKK
jgi:hypothetical protein